MTMAHTPNNMVFADIDDTPGLDWGESHRRLIAAAPELLEALKWYANEERRPSAEHYDGGIRARSAIAKAEGK
jgi:hypothetical protein